MTQAGKGVVKIYEPRNLKAIPSWLEKETFLKFIVPQSFSLLFSVFGDVGSFFF